jgi:hypothetical protein
MRWKEKLKTPFDGQVRHRKVFAWKKTKVGEYIVWLEFYGVEERYFLAASGTGWWTRSKKYTLEHMY